MRDFLPCATRRSIFMRARIFGLAALALECSSMLAPTPAVAADYSVMGAQTLAAGRHATYVTVGLPDAELGATFGLNSIADISPRLRLQYGRGTRIGGAGVGVGAALRMKLARARRWTFAALAEPEVSLHLWGNDVPPTTTTGMPALSIAPFAVGLVADREVLPGVRIVAGLKLPVTFYVQPEWVLNVPLIAELGVETELSRSLILLTRVDTGVDFYGPGGLPGSAPYFRVRVGLGWAR